MLANDAKILKRCIIDKDYTVLYDLNKRMDIKKELVKMFPGPFKRVVKRAGSDGAVCEQTIIDPGKRSLEQVLEILQANRRRLNLRGN